MKALRPLNVECGWRVEYIAVAVEADRGRIRRTSPELEFRHNEPQADEGEGDGETPNDHLSAYPVRQRRAELSADDHADRKKRGAPHAVDERATGDVNQRSG